jgi:hypothetical protein
MKTIDYVDRCDPNHPSSKPAPAGAKEERAEAIAPGMPIASNVPDPESEGTSQGIDRRVRAPDMWNSLPQTMHIQTWLFNRGAAWIVWLRVVWERANGESGLQSNKLNRGCCQAVRVR